MIAMSAGSGGINPSDQVSVMFETLAKRIKQSVLPALAAALVGALVTPVAAQAQPELTTSFWCDKAEQVESIAKAHLAEGVALEAALERTNEAAQDPGACVAATVVVVETGKARRFVTANQMLSIAEFLVIGVVKNGQLVPIEPVTWYSARVVAKLTLL